MARLKTGLRLRIEEFLNDDSTGEEKDMWMGVKVKNKKEGRKVYSMAYGMKREGYHIDIIEYNKSDNTVWISRKVETKEEK